MIRTLVFATICVAAFAQTDPPELHSLNSRVARQALDTESMAKTAIDQMTDIGRQTALTMIKLADPQNYIPSMGGNQPMGSMMNQRRRRFAQQPPGKTTPGQPPRPQ